MLAQQRRDLGRLGVEHQPAPERQVLALADLAGAALVFLSGGRQPDQVDGVARGAHDVFDVFAEDRAGRHH